MNGPSLPSAKDVGDMATLDKERDNRNTDVSANNFSHLDMCILKHKHCSDVDS